MFLLVISEPKANGIEELPEYSLQSSLLHFNISNNSLKKLPLSIWVHKDIDFSFNDKLEKPFSTFITSSELRSYCAEAERGISKIKQEKIIILGDGAVGKTTLLDACKRHSNLSKLKSVFGILPSEIPLFSSTIGISSEVIKPEILGIKPIENVIVQVWDFAGEQ